MDGPTRKPYPSHLTSEQWVPLKMTIPEPKPGGRPRAVEMREIINAMLYINRSGYQWDMLPHDLPPKSTVDEYFAAWRDDGTWQSILDVLRQGYREIHAPSKKATISAASIDSRSVNSTEQGGERGVRRGEENPGQQASYCRRYAGSAVGRGGNGCGRGRREGGSRGAVAVAHARVPATEGGLIQRLHP